MTIDRLNRLLRETVAFKVDRYQDQMIPLEHVLRITGASKDHLLAAMKRGEFPQPVMYGVFASARWSEAAVYAWARARTEVPGLIYRSTPDGH